MASTETPVYYTPDEFAKIVHVHPNTVRLWAREGTIPSIRMGGLIRIPASALDVKDAK